MARLTTIFGLLPLLLVSGPRAEANSRRLSAAMSERIAGAVASGAPITRRSTTRLLFRGLPKGAQLQSVERRSKRPGKSATRLLYRPARDGGRPTIRRQRNASVEPSQAPGERALSKLSTFAAMSPEVSHRYQATARSTTGQLLGRSSIRITHSLAPHASASGETTQHYVIANAPTGSLVKVLGQQVRVGRRAAHLPEGRALLVESKRGRDVTQGLDPIYSTVRSRRVLAVDFDPSEVQQTLRSLPKEYKGTIGGILNELGTMAHGVSGTGETRVRSSQVMVNDLRVAGGRATMNVSYGLSKGEARLVKTDGNWALHSFVPARDSAFCFSSPMGH